MSGEAPRVLVTYRLGSDERGAVEHELAGVAELSYLEGLDGERRRSALGAARVMIAWHPGKELTDDDRGAARSVERCWKRPT